MIKNILKKVGAHSLIAVFFLPIIALAAPTNFKELIMVFLDLINDLVRFVMVLALLFFLFNVFKLVFANGNEESIKEAKSFMIYGIIALFVMVSVWGLVNILTATFFGRSFIVPQLR